VQLINGKHSRKLAKFHPRNTAIKISHQEDSHHLIADVQSRPQLMVADLPGLDQAVGRVNDFLSRFNTEFTNPRARKSCALLLSGFHGTGKTTIIENIVESGWGKVYRVRKDSKVSDVRDVFTNAKLNRPSIVVLDELDAFVSKENAMAHRITGLLEEELDSLANSPPKFMTQVLVVAATLDAGQIPASLRLRSRFRTEILLPIPDKSARKAILKSMDLPIHPELKESVLDRVGDRTHAYTAGDLDDLLEQAYFISEKSFMDVKSNNQYLKEEHIEEAMLIVRPTAMQDVTLKPPAVKWADIGGVPDIKKALQQAVSAPLEVGYTIYRCCIWILT